MQVAGSKDGGWVYTGRHPGSKMEIPVVSSAAEVQTLSTVLPAEHAHSPGESPPAQENQT